MPADHHGIGPYAGPPPWVNPERTPGIGPRFLPFGPDVYGGSGAVPPAPPTTAPRGRRTAQPWTGWLLAACGLAVAAGSLGTWSRLVIPVGTSSTSGLTDGGGAVTLVLGLAVVLAGLAVARGRGEGWVLVGAVTAGVIANLTALTALAAVSDHNRMAQYGAASYHIGAGLLLVLVASLTAGAAALFAAARRRPAERPGSP